MSKKNRTQTSPVIGGLCDVAQRSIPVSISDITPEGCNAEAGCDWDCDCDFVHLKIADSIEINGRVLSIEGRRAQVQFFGQIHPLAIDRLGRLAA